MTPEQLDRKFARYGTVAGVVLGLLAGAAFIYTVEAGQRDYEAEQTKLKRRSAGASYGPYSEWEFLELAPSDSINDAVKVDFGGAVDKWVLWVEGPPACAFTGNRRNHNVSEEFQDFGGGRDISEEEPSSFFIFNGYGPVWVIQGSCSKFDISTCTGWCR